MLKEFKEFALKGSMVDLAIGVIIGAAFGKIVTSLVDNIFSPILGLITGKADFGSIFIPLSGGHYATIEAAKAAGAPTLNIGIFLNDIISFLLIALVIFLIVKQVNRLRKKEESAPTKKSCLFCFSEINVKATRCSACTSELV